VSHEHHGPPKEPIGWTDKPAVVKGFFRVFYVISAILIAAELILGRHVEELNPFEGLFFGFYAVYGFVSFWFLVLLAKPMRKLLIRSEDYYDAE
jgi:hypothetical protein